MPALNFARPVRLRPAWPLSVLVGFTLLALLVLCPEPARSLPEYASQTGEPCASCHLSPAGGGLRAPRGQAWVAGGKGGTVPALADALELLGVHRQVDAGAYRAAPSTVVPAAQPARLTAQAQRLSDWLMRYEGN